MNSNGFTVWRNPAQKSLIFFFNFVHLNVQNFSHVRALLKNLKGSIIKSIRQISTHTKNWISTITLYEVATPRASLFMGIPDSEIIPQRLIKDEEK